MSLPGMVETFAVGTALTGGPPHRSQRALLTHWAPTSGHDAQSLFGIRVQCSMLDDFHLCLLFIHPRAPNLTSLRSAGTMPA